MANWNWHRWAVPISGQANACYIVRAFHSALAIGTLQTLENINNSGYNNTMKLLFLYMCLFVTIGGSAQIISKSTECNKIYSGYILRVFEKCETPFKMCTADIFFCFEAPKITGRNLYSELKNINEVYLLDEQYYFERNISIISASRYCNFYYHTPFDSVKTKEYNVYIYRVVLSGYIHKNLSEYIKKNVSSRRYSAFERDGNNDVEVLCPSMIQSW
jgi:type III secretory pathway component EscS